MFEKLFPAVFDLRTLNGTNGFMLSGVNSGDQSGYSLNTAGDVNGDGIDDIVIGMSNNAQGTSYVVFGQTNGFPPNFELKNLNGTNGFTIHGLHPGDHLGISVDTAGDINGDGKDDVVLGAWGFNNFQGAAYVIFGQTNFSAQFNLATLNGNNGFSVLGSNLGDHLGFSVSAAGDVNADEKGDIVLGAYNGRGACYVIFGRSNFPDSFDLKTLNGMNGFSVYGLNSGDELSFVSTAGDMNGDGKTDIVLGTPYASNNAGTAYVIFGQSNFPANFDLRTLNGTNGFVVPGLAGNGLAQVNTVGDINRDGYADIALGATGANSSQGASYIIFGQSNFPASFDLRMLNGTNGFTVPELNVGDRLGIVGPAGDINDDGIDDVAFGAWGVNNATGASYVIFGTKATPIPSPMPIPNPTPAPAIIHNPPIVLNSPLSQRVEVNQPFEFTFEANQIFNSTEGDPLTFSAQSNDGSPLPQWVYFDIQDTTHLTFTGRPLTIGDSGLALLAKNPWNQSARANFSLSAVAPEPTSPGIPDYAKYLIGAGAGALGFGALIGLGYGLYKACKGYCVPKQMGLRQHSVNLNSDEKESQQPVQNEKSPLFVDDKSEVRF